MTIQQPQSTDELSAIDHAKLHRVLGIDTSAPDLSVILNSLGYVGIGKTPTSAFDVLGTIKASGDLYNTNLRFNEESIEEIKTDADNGDILFNYRGYQGGTTRYRDFSIYDGKTNRVMMFDGSKGSMIIAPTGNPTARLHLPAGTASAETAPLKFVAGVNLTTPEAGAMEFDGTDLYITI